MKRISLLSVLLIVPALVFAAFRPPAVPLVNVDATFSLWSATDRLYESDTVYWTGVPQKLSIILEADGVKYRLCGRGSFYGEERYRVLKQTALKIGALTTTYTFKGPNDLKATVEFMSPKFTDDLDVFSRPVAYVTVRVAGAKSQTVTATIDGAFATNDNSAKMVWATNTVAGLRDISVGRAVQKPLSETGDLKRPNWGYAHLVGPAINGNVTHFILAYDDIYGAQYFGAKLVDWWRRDGLSFEKMLAAAEKDWAKLTAKARAFDREFAADMKKVGGEKYRTIAELAWRQSFGACRLVANTDGEPFFFSCENGSGAMIGTTDVFYPQFPHLLMTSLTLAKASVAPACRYAASKKWPYPYAPHDLGWFPLAEGQEYAMAKGFWAGNDDASRMPMEESGNMLICLATISEAEGHAGFASRWWPQLRQWADYLVAIGYDPGDQLCSDDFAGHMSHNVNLSAKAIIGIAAFARMAELRGERAVAEKYRGIAAKMAGEWVEGAKGGRAGGYKLAFNQPNSWSLKYNLVWDRILGFNLFPAHVAETELAAYRALEDACGLALDSRSTFAKADWTIWAGTLTGKKEDLEFAASGIYRYLNQTADRVPFGDWYLSDSGLYRQFRARSVVGGVYMPVLQYPELVRKYRGASADGVVPFGTTKYGEQAKLYSLHGQGGLVLDVSDYGGKVSRLLVPNGKGELKDVTVGFDNPAGWETTDPYFGAIIGRYASYIARGRFSLEGKNYTLAINDPDHQMHLHGGKRGWNDYVWKTKTFKHRNGDVGIVFTRRSPAGEEGYPGNVDIKVTYTITPENVWRIEHTAKTDAATPINMTHHVYFDMNGEGKALDNELMIVAEKYSPMDKLFTPVGSGKSVAGTPFDFRTFHRVGERIEDPNEILQYGPGYDHNFELDGSGFRQVAELRGRERSVEVWTDQIGLQLYAGNSIVDGWKMKDGRPLNRRSYLALETQHFPDSPNRPDYPTTILRPGETYRTVTEYRFKAR